MSAPIRPGGPPDHDTLRGLLGAWALDACPAEEAAQVQQHLAGCPSCTEEAGRLRDAAGWLSADEPLDPAPSLRTQVLSRALARRPAEVGVPEYAGAFVAETARLDALLRDLGELDWLERAELPWHGGTEQRRPAEVLCHLAAVDGVVSRALGLTDPVPSPDGGIDLVERTERLTALQRRRGPESVRAFWREQTRALVETAALAEAAGRATPAGDLLVDYGAFRLPLRDAFVDRAFECWVHAEDIAEAVGWPYGPPRGVHIRAMVGLATRLLPHALAALRATGAAATPTGRQDSSYGDPRGARAVKLIIEGRGESEWLVPLDVPAPDAPPLPADTEPVATVAIDGVEFCFLCAAHRDPDRTPHGITGDRSAARDLLHAAPLLSRP
ncbi:MULTISPECIES: anti-sigma factor [Streptacidiphilus]|uniref:Anti-sigma factor n=1 Tax=Streptacidiphilus cavernicola TaxID=3342716 RepID=A0ABV6UWV4_9ACTN|nr:zf-HC2 domain-containing protein [Streptacidiphilus jeojiense]